MTILNINNLHSWFQEGTSRGVMINKQDWKKIERELIFYYFRSALRPRCRTLKSRVNYFKKGKEEADLAARSALGMAPDEVKIPFMA